MYTLLDVEEFAEMEAQLKRERAGDLAWKLYRLSRESGFYPITLGELLRRLLREMDVL